MTCVRVSGRTGTNGKGCGDPPYRYDFASSRPGQTPGNNSRHISYRLYKNLVPSARRVHAGLRCGATPEMSKSTSTSGRGPTVASTAVSTPHSLRPPRKARLRRLKTP